MTNLIIAWVLLALALVGVVIRKTYFYLPLNELKRKARGGDKLAQQLYRAAAYQNSLRSLLWLYIGFSTAGSIILMARELPLWVSLLVVGPALWIVFSLIPATRLTGVGQQLTVFVTPIVAVILNYTDPILHRSSNAVSSRYKRAEHTRLFERQDVLDLLDRQLDQPDNRLSEEEIDIAKRALTFGDRRVRDVLVSRKHVKIVKPGDTLGPVLIDEIHKTGQNYALVQRAKKDPFVGSLSYHKLGLHSSGKVSEVMDTYIYYLHESDSLTDALHAFYVTNQPVFVVVNSFEEYVGILTIDTLLQQILGHVPGDEFDQYADITAVANRYTKPKPSVTTADTSVETEEKVVE